MKYIVLFFILSNKFYSISYVLKCYDKSAEQRKSGNTEVEDGLLRIELVMQDRVLKRLFAKRPTMREVLTK